MKIICWNVQGAKKSQLRQEVGFIFFCKKGKRYNLAYPSRKGKAKIILQEDTT